MQTIFDWCVRVLIILANWTGLSYEAINVILFVFVHPALTLSLLIWGIRLYVLRKKERRLS